jgi:hypothetical protein
LSLAVLAQAGLQLLIAGAALILGLLIIWIIVSVPVWIAAKILTLGRARFTRAMLVTAIGPIVVAVVYFLSRFILSAAVGSSGFITALAFILAFIAWIGVFKKAFETGWLRAFAIAILASIAFIVLGALIGLVIHAFIPQAPRLPFSPIPLQSV